MKTLDEVIREVSKRNGDLDKEIWHYLMMYRYLLRKQAEQSQWSDFSEPVPGAGDRLREKGYKEFTFKE